MGSSIEELLSNLSQDTLREVSPFSPDVADSNRSLFSESASDEDAIRTLSKWLQTSQPCLFGRMAAKFDQIEFCVLRELDVGKGDIHISEKIQAARLRWTRAGYKGTKSGFIIALVSPRLVNAAPDLALQQLAQHLASLYLLKPVDPDVIYHDELWLELPNSQQTTWVWQAGINFFGAMGDGRWWQDHRIPGGIALSVNSVGHMAKSGLLNQSLSKLREAFPEEMDAIPRARLSSLPDAHELAMLTIDNAADAVSGKATQLIARQTFDESQDLSVAQTLRSSKLQARDIRHYLGWYHTDVTVPTVYFRPDVERPLDVQRQVLDFSYLFDNSAENPDFVTMGEGRPIRDHGAIDLSTRFDLKRWRATPRVVSTQDCPRLLTALGQGTE